MKAKRVHAWNGMSCKVCSSCNPHTMKCDENGQVADHDYCFLFVPRVEKFTKDKIKKMWQDHVERWFYQRQYLSHVIEPYY